LFSVSFAGGGCQKRRASEPAFVNYTGRSTAPPLSASAAPQSSSVADYREIVASWFTSATTHQRAPAADSGLARFVDRLLTDAFVQSATSLCVLRRQHHPARRHRHKLLRHDDDVIAAAGRDVTAVPDVIASYAQRLAGAAVHAAELELPSAAPLCASLRCAAGAVQSVAEQLATSIVDDVLLGQPRRSSSTAHRPLVSDRTRCKSVLKSY